MGGGTPVALKMENPTRPFLRWSPRWGPARRRGSPPARPAAARTRARTRRGARAAGGEPAGGRQGSVLRAQDLPELRHYWRPGLRHRRFPRRQGLLGGCVPSDRCTELPMIDSALAGFNTSLVCYGQSGTGSQGRHTSCGGPSLPCLTAASSAPTGHRASLLPTPPLPNKRSKRAHRRSKHVTNAGVPSSRCAESAFF